jgi:antirestriction protein ArdC
MAVARGNHLQSNDESNEQQTNKPSLEHRQGEHGSLVVHADKIIRTQTDTDTDTGEESEHAIPFMKGYTVFNVEQDRRPARAPLRETRAARPDRAAHRARGKVLRRARRHSPAWRQPRVLQPGFRSYADAAFESFRDAESYYATLAHEETHWTRHPSRLTATLAASGSVMKATPSRSS